MTGDLIRPATGADFRAFYDRNPRWRAQAVVVEAGDGGLLGIGGVERQPSGVVVFMDLAPGVDATAHKRALVKAARAVLAIAERSGGHAYAIRDRKLPGSEAFLTHFGFVRCDEARRQEVWRRWKP